MGDFIEVLDTIKKWCVARVIEKDIEKKRVKVKYSGWGDKWNEYIDFSSPRLCVKLGTNVAVTQNTGSKKRLKEGMMWDVTIECLREMHKPLNKFISRGQDEDESIEWMMEMQDFVRRCLISNYVEDSKIPIEVNAYLQKVVVAFAHSLKRSPHSKSGGSSSLSSSKQSLPVSPIFLHCFKRIFSSCFFYDNFGKVSMGSRFSSFFGARGKNDGTYAEQNGYVSDYLVANVNAFGKAGGFDSVLRRLSIAEEEEESSSSSGNNNNDKSDKKEEKSNLPSSKSDDASSSSMIMPMEELAAILNAFSNVSELFPSSFKRKYFPTFQSLVFRRMLSMDIQSLRSLAQNQRSNGIIMFQDSTKSLFNLIGNVLKGDEADRVLEVFKLRLAKRLMSTPFFTLKLRGSDDLIDQINMTLRRERRDSFRERGDEQYEKDKSSPGMMSRIFGGKGYRTDEDSLGRKKVQRPKSKWLKCKWLSEWIVKNEIIHLILQSPGDTHTEMLKRSRRVLLFLAQNEALTTQDMTLLCGHINTDETTRKDVYIILEDLANELPVSQLTKLFDIVVKSSKNCGTPSLFLEFLQRYTENAMCREMRKGVSSSKRNA